eukprot:1908475-Amphidinium_carterae.2
MALGRFVEWCYQERKRLFHPCCYDALYLAFACHMANLTRDNLELLKASKFCTKTCIPACLIIYHSIERQYVLYPPKESNPIGKEETIIFFVRNRRGVQDAD